MLWMGQDGRMKNHLSYLGGIRRHRTPEEISEILRKHRHSGLSLLAFADKYRLCYSTLVGWKRREPKEARSGGSPGFVPIQIEPGSLNSDYVLSWPEGRTLRIPAGFSAQRLRELLEILEECK